MILNGKTIIMVDLECCQDTCIDHGLGIHCTGNGSIMISSVDGCDNPNYRDRGDVSSSDGIFVCDFISSICFNVRDTVLADARQVIDALLVKVRQG